MCCPKLHMVKYFVGIQTTLKETSYILLLFECETSHTKAHWDTLSQLMELFEKVLEQLGGGSLLEEMDQWGKGLKIL